MAKVRNQRRLLGKRETLERSGKGRSKPLINGLLGAQIILLMLDVDISRYLHGEKT
jgi:hypothetical protein